MTLDAMHWVWNHSQSKGNARLALLCVADQVRTAACEARLSYSDFMTALNAASKSTVRDALKAAEKLGELEVAESGSGRRAPLYRLPKAVDYARPSGTKSVPLEGGSGTGSVPQSPEAPSASGTGSVPQEDRSGTDFVRSGTDFAPSYPSPSLPSKHEGEMATDGGDYGIPEDARPLVDSMSASGVIVRWPFKGNEWFRVLALINKCGIPALVEYARRTADRTPVDSAKYFLRGWSELPPKPANGTPVHVPRPHPRSVSGSGLTPEERGIF